MNPDQRAAEIDCSIGIHGLHSSQRLHPQENHHSSSSSNNGWPLGLHSFLDQIDSGYHHLRLQTHSYGHSHGALAPHTARSLSTPSITSRSCSSDDFETQSSGSFFPDRSTTLGSLIGLRSRPQTQANHSKASQHRAEKTRKKQQQEGEERMAMEAASAMLHRDRACCSLLVCRAGDRHKEMGMSPSLAHLLGKEKKAMGPSFLERKNKVRPWIKHRHGSVVVEQAGFALFDTGIIPSLPPPPQRASGTPLKLFLQRSSPNSSYVSTHWDAFLRRSEAHRDEPAQDTRHSHGGIWSSLCFKDSAKIS